MLKKKIYFLINSLEGGGAERVITTLASKMIDEFYVTLITLKNSLFYDLPQGVHHVSLSNIKNNFLMFLLIPRYVVKLKKFLKKEQFFTGVSFLEIANFVHILTKKNAIISFRTSIAFFTGFLGKIQKFLIKWLYPKAKIIIVNSEENRYDLADFLDVPLSQILTIYNPIDVKKVEKLKREKIEDNLLQKIHGKKIFITTGRLILQKHHEKIIYALKRIYDRFDKNWIYLIIGDGPQMHYLQLLTKKLGLHDHIIFLGQQKNVFKYLNIADYFVYASQYEGFPNVLIESMACGLPIITSDFKTGAKELILGEYKKNQILKYPYFGTNGVLLDLEDYKKEFVEVYKQIITLGKQDKNLSNFDSNSISKQWKQILSD